LALLFMEYVSQNVFHLTRLFHFAEKWNIAKTGFKIWNIVFVLVRLASAVLAVLTLWYGLRSNETPYIDSVNGNFNTAFIRLNSLLCVLALQLYMLWNFVLFHVRRYREKHSKIKIDKQSKIQQRRRKHVNDDVSLFIHLNVLPQILACRSYCEQHSRLFVLEFVSNFEMILV
uniref:TLC domain-containing protein n=1 Tax=Brugia timori TaxID=42155 RepID=A0A0R3QGC2_9BILA